MFRKIRRPTPDFKIPTPFNAMRGGFDDLQTHGQFPYCTLMQIACEDKYNDYVVCRGFDPRMLKFIDYAEGSSEKPGISVAKPYGCRVYSGGAKRYRVGEMFPAFLPTQGLSDIDPHFVPPSPVEVRWRLGQNPGTIGSGGYGGHPKCLTDEISILYDHNGQVVNWMLVHTETKLFRFQALENLVGESCDACVRQMSGSYPHTAKIYHADNLFEGLLEGTKGIVQFQEGKYWIINAKCEPDELEACECEPVGENDCECKQ